MDPESTSTRENLFFLQNIIEEQGFNTEIAIVTNEYHEYRAAMIADDLGMEHSAVPVTIPLWLFPTLLYSGVIQNYIRVGIVIGLIFINKKYGRQIKTAYFQ